MCPHQPFLVGQNAKIALRPGPAEQDEFGALVCREVSRRIALIDTAREQPAGAGEAARPWWQIAGNGTPPRAAASHTYSEAAQAMVCTPQGPSRTTLKYPCAARVRFVSAAVSILHGL